MKPPRLAGAYEVAEALGTTPQAVGNWAKRYPDFPEPLARLAMATVWDLDEVLRWHERRWGPTEGAKGVARLATATEVARHLGHPVSPQNVVMWHRKFPDFPEPRGFRNPERKWGPLFDLSEATEWYRNYGKRMHGVSGRRLRP